MAGDRQTREVFHGVSASVVSTGLTQGPVESARPTVTQMALIMLTII